MFQQFLIRRAFQQSHVLIGLSNDYTVLQIGLGESVVLNEYHKDGIKLFNKTMNLRLVVDELRDAKYRILNEVQAWHVV